MGYSYDLRERVIAAVERGDAVESVAERFQVCQRTVFDWMRIKRETGDLNPRPGKPGPKLKLEALRSEIEALVDRSPEITLEEIKARLELTCVLTTIWNALTRWGITLKKSHAGRRATAA